jgi:ABC-2 type transport system permease protein
MTALLYVYRAQFAASLGVWFAYRWPLLIWFFVRLVEPAIYISVWSSVAVNQGGEINGLSPSQFSAYYIVLMAVNQLTFVWLLLRFNTRIQTGTLSIFLLRPVSLFHHDLADVLANKLIVIGMLIPSVILMSALFSPSFGTPIWVWIVLLPVVVLAFLLRFVLDYCVAMLAFWTTRIDALDRLYFTILFLFSGRVAPIDLLPTTVRAVAEILPVRWILSFPAELALGQMSIQNAAQGMITQCLWIGVFGVLAWLLWKKSLQQYTAVDG